MKLIKSITLSLCLLIITTGLSFADATLDIVIETVPAGESISVVIEEALGGQSYENVRSLTIKDGYVHKEHLVLVDQQMTQLKKLYIGGDAQITTLKFPAYFQVENEAIEEVIIEASASKWYMLDKNSFRECPNLTTLIMPNCRYIHYYSVFGNPKLSTIDFSNLQGIHSNVFSDNDSLVHVDLPKLEEISKDVFKGCDNLESLKLLRLYRFYGFNDLPKLSTLEFGEYPPYVASKDKLGNFINNKPIIKVPEVGSKWYLGEYDGDTTDHYWYGLEIQVMPAPVTEEIVVPVSAPVTQ